MTNTFSPILRPKQAASYIGLSLPSFWRIANEDPTFPPLFKLSSNATAVMRSDIDDWLESKKEAGHVKGKQHKGVAK